MPVNKRASVILNFYSYPFIIVQFFKFRYAGISIFNSYWIYLIVLATV